MRLIYADPGLHGLSGHHPNVCRSLLDTLARLSVPTVVLAFAGVEPPLRQALNAIPFFRHNQYWATDRNPVRAFQSGAQLMREDLHRRSDIGPDDVLFIPWARPAQFSGVVHWMRDLLPHRLPRVVVNFLDILNVTPEQGSSVELSDDFNRPLLRFAASHVTTPVASRLRLGCNFSEGAAVLKAALGLDVEQLPAPQHATTSRRRRSATGPVTIGIVGHQQAAKGVRHIADSVRGVLGFHPGAHILIHDSSHDLPSEVADELSRLRASGSHITLHREALDAQGWANLLDRIDLLLCPYLRDIYRLCASGVHNEAIANGIPSVVPSDTTLATQGKAFGEGTVTFGAGEPASIVDSVRRVLDDFDRYARAAHAGAALWPQVNGPEKLVEKLLKRH